MEKKELTPNEKWEQATIANDFIFFKVMRDNPDVCQRLLEILLEFDIDHIDMNCQEHIDIDCLGSGQPYKDLKDSYIIFICIPDIFKKGLPVYTFENLCRQDTTIPLGDRTLKYFFISDNCDKLLNEEQKAFMKLVSGQKGSNSFTERIAHLADEVKHNIEYKRQYMEGERQKTYEYNRGKQEKPVESVKGLYKNGVTIEIIAKSLDMNIEQIEDIVKEYTLQKA